MSERRSNRPGAPDQASANARLEERLAGRIDDSVHALQSRMDSSFEVVVGSMAGIQAELRRGQIDRKGLATRLGELETAIGENRDATNLLRNKIAEIDARSKAQAVEALIEAAPIAAATATRAAPAELWSSLSNVQKFVAIWAACVAILAGFSGAMTGAERLAAGLAEGFKAAWIHSRGPTRDAK